MSGLSSWLKAMDPYQTDYVGLLPSIQDISSLRFLRHMNHPATDTIYIGEATEVFDVLKCRTDCEKATFFASGKMDGLQSLAKERGVNLVTTELDIFCIYDRLLTVMQQYQHWSQRLLEAANRRNNIREVVQTVSKLSDTLIILLNSNCRIVYSSEANGIDEPIADDILKTGYLSDDSEQVLLGKGWNEENLKPPFVCRRLQSGNICWAMKVFKDNKLISIMLAFAPPSLENPYMATLMDLIKSSISRIVTMEDLGYWTGTDFKTLLDDLVEQRLTDEVEINKRFNLILRTPQRFYNIIIIEFDSPNDLLHISTDLFMQLEKIFPDSNVAVYKKAVVLMLSRRDRMFQPTPIFDNEKFMELLSYYNAFASVSNATSHRAKFRTSYLMTKRILQLGKALRLHPFQRIFFFEDYAEYFMIHLCKNSFHELLGHDDIIYLTHPDAIVIERYDKKHNMNLLDVLYYYCLNNCNVAQTAKATYMHRNTVARRIAKIQELINADLSNGETQHRIVFSYKILRYFDKYEKVDLKKRLNNVEDSLSC